MKSYEHGTWINKETLGQHFAALGRGCGSQNRQGGLKNTFKDAEEQVLQ